MRREETREAKEKEREKGTVQARNRLVTEFTAGQQTTVSGYNNRPAKMPHMTCLPSSFHHWGQGPKTLETQVTWKDKCNTATSSLCLDGSKDERHNRVARILFYSFFFLLSFFHLFCSFATSTSTGPSTGAFTCTCSSQVSAVNQLT